MTVTLQTAIPALGLKAGDWQWNKEEREVCPPIPQLAPVQPGQWAATALFYTYAENADNSKPGFWSFRLVKWAAGYAGITHGLYVQTASAPGAPKGTYLCVAVGRDGEPCAAALPPLLEVKGDTDYTCVFGPAPQVSLNWEKLQGNPRMWLPEWAGSGIQIGMASPVERRKGLWSLEFESFGSLVLCARYEKSGPANKPDGDYDLVAANWPVPQQITLG